MVNRNRSRPGVDYTDDPRANGERPSRCPGRPRLEDQVGQLWRKKATLALQLREDYATPWYSIALELDISPRTARRYVARLSEIRESEGL
jgi:hypothetical protein